MLTLFTLVLLGTFIWLFRKELLDMLMGKKPAAKRKSTKKKKK